MLQPDRYRKIRVHLGIYSADIDTFEPAFDPLHSTHFARRNAKRTTTSEWLWSSGIRVCISCGEVRSLQLPTFLSPHNACKDVSQSRQLSPALTQCLRQRIAPACDQASADSPYCTWYCQVSDLACRLPRPRPCALPYLPHATNMSRCLCPVFLPHPCACSI